MAKKVSDMPDIGSPQETDLLYVARPPSYGKLMLSTLGNWLLQTFKGFIQAGAGAVARPLQDRLRETISTKDFGAVGDGVADDTAALLAFFTAASGKRCVIPPGTYNITSLLTLPALSNCVIEGVPGQTVITGSFGYGLVLLGAMNNVHFYGVTFQSTYSNAALSSNTGVVYQASTNYINSSFRCCKFTAPAANTQGLVLFNRTSAAGSDACVIDGAWIEDNEFVSLGSIGCTIMNRQTSADRYSAAKRVYFNRNKGKDLGLLNANSYGFLVSLDGFGSTFTVDHNEVDNPNGIGIENTGWINGSLSHNKFRNFGGTGRRARAMSVADASAVNPASGLTVVGNVCEDAATTGSYASFLNDSYFSGNVWQQTGTGLGSERGFTFLDSNRNKVTGDRYVSDQAYAIRFMSTTGVCQGNVIRDAQFTTAGSAANIAVVNCDGASTSGNTVFGTLTKGIGGNNFTQTASAANNQVGYDAVGSGSLSLTFATPGDLNYIGTCPYRYTRQGRLCTITFELDSTTFTWTTAASSLRLTGLPFTASASSTTSAYGVLALFRGITKANYTQFMVRAVGGQTYLQFYASGQGQAPTSVVASDVPSGGTVALYGSITYEVAD